MTVDMGVTIQQLTYASSAQLAGLAFGCLFFIPLTIKYGRRPTYVVSCAVLAGVTWWSAKMQSNGELIVTSIITGLAGAINETAVQMTVRRYCPIKTQFLCTDPSPRYPTSFLSTVAALQMPFTSPPSW